MLPQSLVPLAKRTSLKRTKGSSRAKQTGKQITDADRGRRGASVRLNNQEEHNHHHNGNYHEIENIHDFLIQRFSMHGLISIF
jgi:hypothetical protein